MSEKQNIQIEIDERLSERILSSSQLPDWQEKLRASYSDFDLKLIGGESSREAMDRIVPVVEEALTSESEHVVIVSHGNIISLLLHNYDRKYGFDCWKDLSNPDIFQLDIDGPEAKIARVWGSREITN